MQFSLALHDLKMGARVRRAGWNGNGMWIALVRPQRDQVYYAPSAPLTERRLDPALRVTFDTPLIVERLSVLPYIAMRTADAGWVPWLASQTDILADDWEAVS